MKVVILAGGLGTRIGEETVNRPKPMMEIGAKPIIWHIMKLYSHYGINDFIICCGYKGYIIKEYFLNYMAHAGDVTIDLENNQVLHHYSNTEQWKVTLADTGPSTMTGGRIKKIAKYLKGENNFCLTYGDGLANVNIKSLISFHEKSKTLATVTGVYPPARFGSLEVDNNDFVTEFNEKPLGQGGLINGGFFVLSTNTINFIEDDQTVWEQEPLRKLSSMGQLKVFQHTGFWQPMDTMRDKILLENMWNSGNPPWKLWKDSDGRAV